MGIGDWEVRRHMVVARGRQLSDLSQRGCRIQHNLGEKDIIPEDARMVMCNKRSFSLKDMQPLL